MKNNLKSNFLLFLVMAFALLLVACSGGDDSGVDSSNSDNTTADSSSSSTEVEAAAGGDLVLATLSDAANLDPHMSTDVPSASVLSNITEGLVKKDKEGNIVPSLAKSWTAVDDVTWEFELEEGITFHDGEDFNAAAVKKNFDRILDPEVGAPRAFLFEAVKEVEVVSDYVVRIHTHYPFAPLLNHLNHPVGVIISPAQIDADYENMKADQPAGALVNEQGPIGTGFMKFDYWTPGTEIKLVNNEDYWSQKAYVDSVTFKVIPESATRAAELETGYAHIIEPVQPNEVEMIEGTTSTVDITPGSSLSYVGFNIDKEPFDDVRVRQAISMLVDQQLIIDGIYEGIGEVAKGPLAPSVYGYDDSVEPLTYDVEKAKELLAEAGLADGFTTTIWTNDNPQRQDIAIMLQEELKKINVTADIEVVEWGAYLAKTAAGEHDMYILGLSNPVGDADYFLTQLFHSKNHGDAGNRMFYTNDRVDALLDEAREEIDTTKRLALYKEIQDILVEEAPMIYIHHQAYISGVSEKIEGYWINDSGHHKLQEVKFIK
ncbi:glutathione ABC transporter substrate-binding protein [Solibacillus sp. FSL W7-1464]|uniref:glutathione ABC transporter substrate-binding protein n=1 Tax=Solibacillus sp. FSL W7-1464 TaxID=2921706 RepID=UPI0030FCF9AF